MQTKGITVTIAVLISCMLAGCSTMQNTYRQTEGFITRNKIKRTAKTQYAATNPEIVALTNKAAIKRPYVTVAQLKVSQRNIVGVKRQKAFINDLMRKDAATIGGHAVINISHDKYAQYGDVIHYTNRIATA
jgi:outer membrane murein-binding lipoprotein Lpp